MRQFFSLAIVTLGFGFVAACSEGEVSGLGDSGVHADAGPFFDDRSMFPDALPSPDADENPDGGEVPERATVSSETIDFGTLVVSSTASAILTISNPSLAPVPVTIADLTGPDAELFAISMPAGLINLDPGMSIDITIDVAPQMVGGVTATLPLLLCEGGCPAAITLLADAVDTGIQCDRLLDFGIVAPATCGTGTVQCDNIANQTEQLLNAQIIPANDPNFSITNSPALPMDFAPGNRVTFDLSFCPAMVGDRLATLLIDADRPARQHTIELRGHGGGANITCTPSDLDFGIFGAGAEVHRSVVCTNDGFETGSLLGVLITAPEFTTAQGAATIGVGESIEIDVAASATTIGTISGTMEITTDDPDAPIISVTLHGEAVDVQPCTATLSPPAVDFGLVPVGSVRRAPVVLENAGTARCLVDLVSILGGSSPAITLVNAPPAGTAIDPGAQLTFEARFAPAIAGTVTATLSATFSNPMTPPLAAVITGAAGTTTLAIDPPAVDFGSVPAGCAAPATRTITLQSTSALPIDVTAIDLVTTSSNAITMGTQPVPVTIRPLGTLDLTIGFSPTLSGNYSAELRITVAGAAAPYVVHISGTAGASAARVDTFDYASPAVDVLILADDSCSMGPGQAAFAEAIPILFPRLIERGADVHIGVITSDMDDAAKQGRLQGLPGYVDQNTMDLLDVVAARVVPGTTGAGVERPIDAMSAALSAPLTSMENAGFKRAGVDLAIIFFTDEDDQSITDVEAAVDVMRAAAAGGSVSIYGIAGPRADPSCNGPAGPAQPAPRLFELSLRADRGAMFSFCDGMTPSVSTIADAIFGAPSFALSAEPRPETITVSAGGVAIPQLGPTGEVLWSYDFLQNRVVFTLAGAPANGATISIAYEGFCLSPTCGDGSTDTFESCDDGNMDDGDGCTAGCRLASCGDGFVQQGVEACDDQNTTETDACLSTCAAAACGDGFLRAGVEDCEDGNIADGDGCPSTCIYQRDVSAFYSVGALTAAVYAPLAVETPVMLADPDEGSTTITLDYPVVVFGAAINAIDVSPNGFASTNALAGLTATGLNGPFPLPDAPSGLIAPWWEDLTVDAAVTGGASLAYEVQGMAPNRVTVIQWRGVRLANHTTSSNRRFNFQIALFETTNVIQYRYGETQTSGAPPTATTASAGIENGDGTAGQNLLTCTPACAGPARPGNPNGFPRQTQITLTPL